MIELLNFLETSFNKRFFILIADKVLKGEKKEGEISVLLVDEKTIREFNKKYRHQDKVTDVLSFCYQEGKKFVFPPKNLLQLGEVIICPPFIKKESKKQGLNFKKELARAFIHSILHLLGYNHRTVKDLKKMEVLQKKYLSNFYV
jgi:probable rRNA maturation factor